MFSFGPCFDHLAMFEQEDMGHIFCNFFCMVGDVDHGWRVIQLFDMMDLTEETFSGKEIQSTRSFVKDDQIWLVHEASCNEDRLLFSLGELPVFAADQRASPNRSQHIPCPVQFLLPVCSI